MEATEFFVSYRVKDDDDSLTANTIWTEKFNTIEQAKTFKEQLSREPDYYDFKILIEL